MAAELDCISAPYNFVPLSDWVHEPTWAAQISHDVPFRNGLCGHLDLKITAVTPLLVGREQQKATGTSPGRVDPYQLPDGRYAIPGTALKGMIRNVVEIATFSRMGAVDDVRFGLRDISGPYVSAAYTARVRDKIASGFMDLANDGLPRITPCEMVRLAHRELETWLRVPKPPIFPADRSVARKYEQWRTHCKSGGQDPNLIRFVPKDGEATSLGEGPIEGVPVFTGQVSDSTGKRGKRRDFVFFNKRPSDAFALAPQDWNDFLAVHGDHAAKDAENMSWPGYWKKRYWAGEPVPVFYLREPGKTRVGLAYMPRLANDFSTHQMRNHTSVEHGNGEGRSGWDFAEAIFGTVGEQPDACLKGRVTFHHAIVAGKVMRQPQDATILNGPKASYFPNYLKQPSTPDGRLKQGTNYATGLATKEHPRPELRGWKRYPAREDAQVQPLTQEQRSNKNVQVLLNPLPAGIEAATRVSFHNLRVEELGALVWALTWGGAEGLRHSLGMGKPFGFGQIALAVTDACIIPNRRGAPCPSWEDARETFIAYMDGQHRAVKKTSWRESQQIRTLLGMADPAKARNFKGELRHMRLEKNEFTIAKQVPLALLDYPPREHPQTRAEIRQRREETEREARKTPEDREIEKLRTLYETAQAQRNPKPGDPLGQRFGTIINDAQAWPQGRRDLLIPLLEEINKFLDGDEKKRSKRIDKLRAAPQGN